MKTLGRRRDQAELLHRLKTIRPDSAARWGRMSAHQMVCHLCDSFRMAIGRKRVSAATGPLQRTILKWIVLYAPVRWPAGIVTRPEIDQAQGGTRPGEFAADVTQLESLLALVTAGSVDWQAHHPIFGRMSEAAWLRWAYLHMDHHLRQFGA
jgi:Protein of unknown function (DUF1569)